MKQNFVASAAIIGLIAFGVSTCGDDDDDGGASGRAGQGAAAGAGGGAGAAGAGAGGGGGGGAGAGGAGGGAGPPSTVADWSAIAVDLISKNQPAGPQTRSLAIVQIAVHDALNAVDAKYKPFEYAVGAPGASAPAAVAAAAHDTLVRLLPPAAAAIDAQYAAALAAIPGGAAKDAGVVAGKGSAAAILALRGGDDLVGAVTKPYTPGPADPGVYQPTPPLNMTILAGWGELPAFVLPSNSQFRSPPPFAINSPEYTADYDEVKSLGSAASATRTAEQTETARFWYDAATKEWNRAAQQGLAEVGADDWRAARTLALVNIALADVVVASYDTKFSYNYWRPLTAIRAGEADGNASTQGDAAWEPLCVTPPFPDYNSTHATAGGAAAGVLALELGDSHTFTVDSPTLPGVTRTYATFSAAAAEVAASRIYCGIHFRNAATAGLAQGQAVAAYVFGNVLRPVD